MKHPWPVRAFLSLLLLAVSGIPIYIFYGRMIDPWDGQVCLYNKALKTDVCHTYQEDAGHFLLGVGLAVLSNLPVFVLSIGAYFALKYPFQRSDK